MFEAWSLRAEWLVMVVLVTVNAAIGLLGVTVVSSTHIGSHLMRLTSECCTALKIKSQRAEWLVIVVQVIVHAAIGLLCVGAVGSNHIVSFLVKLI